MRWKTNNQLRVPDTGHDMLLYYYTAKTPVGTVRPGTYLDIGASISDSSLECSDVQYVDI